MDKSLKDLKRDFFNKKMEMSMEDIMVEMNKTTMNINLPMNDWKSHKKYTMEYFIGMNRNYEFNDTMAIHSLVRALQYSKKKGQIMPKTKMVLEMDDRLATMNEKIKFKDWMYEDDRDKLYKEKIKLEEELDKTKVDLMDFTEMVMLMGDEKTSNLNLFQSLDKLEDYEMDMNKSLENYPMIYKYLHSTMKKIRFYISPIGMSVSGKELLTHMFEEKHPSSNRLIESTMNLFQHIKNFPISDIYKNPFDCIKKLMMGSVSPFKDFYDYMKDTFKNMKFMEMNLVSDFNCSGNFFDNLQKMMMTRMTPDYIRIFPSDKYTRDEEALKFLTNITLANYNNMMKTDLILPIDMSSRITKLNRAKNMYTAVHNKDKITILNNMIETDRVEYTKSHNNDKTEVTHFWTDYKVSIVCKEMKNKVNMYLFSSIDLDNDEVHDRRIFNIFNKFKLEMDIMRKRIQNMTLQSWSMKYSMSYIELNFEIKTQIQRLFKKWRMMLYMCPLKDTSLMKAMDYSYTSLVLFEDDYTSDYDTMMNMKLDSGEEEVYTMKQLYNDIPDLEMLDNILVKYDLLPVIRMPILTKKEDTDKYLDVQNILKQFNESAQSSNIIMNLSKMFMDYRMSSEEEDEEMDRMSTIDNNDMQKDKLEGYEDPSMIMMAPIMNLNPLVEGIMKMKELYFSEKDQVIEDEVIYEDERSINKMKRTKMANMTHELIKKSLETCIDVDKRKMKRVYDSFKRNGNEVGFHNLLLLQIHSTFDFNLSDSMAMFLYNQFLIKMSSMYIIKPTFKVIKYGPNMTDLINEPIKFIYRKSELDEEMSEALEKF
jgi:hypothetical protein